MLIDLSRRESESETTGGDCRSSAVARLSNGTAGPAELLLSGPGWGGSAAWVEPACWAGGRALFLFLSVSPLWHWNLHGPTTRSPGMGLYGAFWDGGEEEEIQQLRFPLLHVSRSSVDVSFFFVVPCLFCSVLEFLIFFPCPPLCFLATTVTATCYAMMRVAA